ncbi:MAG: TIGR03943 family protein [Synechococcales cyanobacterium]
MGRKSGLGAWLDPIALVAWGSLPYFYAAQGRLTLLVRSEYLWLVLVAGILLVGLGVGQGVLLWRADQNGVAGHRPSLGWGSRLLLAAVVLGIIFSPRPLSSQTALVRGGGNLANPGRLAPQRFQIVLDPSQRSLLDWVRTVQAYPDPDSYAGQAVNIQGFVIHPPEASAETFWLARFVIGCCAADAYPVGLWVHWPQAATLPSDQWQRVTGTMAVGVDAQGSRQLRVMAESVQAIPTPQNPYG